MNATSILESTGPGAKAPKESSPTRLFYTLAASVLLVIALIGFQQFYLHGQAVGARPIPPKMYLLTVAHGIMMSSWIILFLVQPVLIVSGNRRQHMLLGQVGAILAAAIIVVGLSMAIESVRLSPNGSVLHGLTQTQFLVVPLTDIAKFALFVLLGVWYRRRAEVHRPMMLLATLTLTTAASARIAALTRPYDGTFVDYLFGPYVPMLVLGALFLVVHWLLTRKFDRYYALGYAGVVITTPLIMGLARSEAWGRFTAILFR